MKLLHYSREGYEGNYLYTSVCGKDVEANQNNEGSTIHPEMANCKECLATKELKTDIKALKNTTSNIKRRIYIESDILHADEFRTAQDTVSDFVKRDKLKCVERVFSDVLDFAWHNLETTWLAVKNADEIYAMSSLIPLSGGSYSGAPVIFNGMCKKAIEENVTGKKIVILNDLKNIYWDMIDINLMKKAFKENDLYMYDDDSDLVKIDVSKIKDKK